MANQRKPPRKKPSSNGRKPRSAVSDLETAIAPEVLASLPPDFRGSPAWQHFQAAQLEFLTGMQFLLRDLLERMGVPQQSPKLKRIEVKK